MNQANRFVMSRDRGVCCKCNGKPTLHAQKTAAGLKGVYWCVTCGELAHGGSSWTSLRQLSADVIAALPRLPASEESCWVCMKTAVLEEHHLAPHAQFGVEADLWPTVRVCNDCHRKWEDRMGTHPWRDAK